MHKQTHTMPPLVYLSVLVLEQTTDVMTAVQCAWLGVEVWRHFRHHRANVASRRCHAIQLQVCRIGQM